MGDLVNQLTAFPPPSAESSPLSDDEYDRLARQYVAWIQKIEVSTWKSLLEDNVDILEILKPQIHSIAYLHIILRSISPTLTEDALSENFKPDTQLWTYAKSFITNLDATQVRYAGPAFSTLIELVYRRALLHDRADDIVQPLLSLILQIDPSSSTLTSTHLYFVHACLLAKEYDQAIAILSKPIYHIPTLTTRTTEATVDSLSPYLCSPHDSNSNYINVLTGLTKKLEYQDFLRYFLYGAMCYMAVKSWATALAFLEIVLSAPTANTTSCIQVEAYKKFLLVSLLHRGEIVPIPRTMSAKTAATCQILAKPYIALANIFAKGLADEADATALTAEIHDRNIVWQEDYNTGLVMQTLDAYQEFTIRMLGKTYAAMTVPEVSRRISTTTENFGEMGKYIIRLISQNRLSGTLVEPTLDPATWILNFVRPSNRDDGATDQDYDEIATELRQIENLSNNVREIHRKFSLSKEYIQTLKAYQKAQEKVSTVQGPQRGTENWQQPPFSAFDTDEDMMAE